MYPFVRRDTQKLSDSIPDCVSRLPPSGAVPLATLSPEAGQSSWPQPTDDPFAAESSSIAVLPAEQGKGCSANRVVISAASAALGKNPLRSNEIWTQKAEGCLGNVFIILQ